MNAQPGADALFGRRLAGPLKAHQSRHLNPCCGLRVHALNAARGFVRVNACACMLLPASPRQRLPPRCKAVRRLDTASQANARLAAAEGMRLEIAHAYMLLDAAAAVHNSSLCSRNLRTGARLWLVNAIEWCRRRTTAFNTPRRADVGLLACCTGFQLSLIRDQELSVTCFGASTDFSSTLNTQDRCNEAQA